MRLNISFLQKTPVWVFFCFCAVVLLLSPIESHAAVSVDYLTLNQTMNDFENATRTWQDIFQNAAISLFWLLVPVAMVWRFGQIAMQGGGATEALAELVRFTIFVGFYWWLVKYGCTIAEAILKTMQQLAGRAVGTNGSLDPADIVNLGLNTLLLVVKKDYPQIVLTNIGQDISILFIIAACMLFAIICAVVAINLLLAIVTVYILMYAGIIILGFGATSWTSEMAIGYFRSVFNASMRVAGMILVVGVCENVIKHVSDKVLTEQNFQDSFIIISELLITAVMMYLLTEKIPDQLASLTSGSLGSNHATVSHAGSFATAQMAAGLAISAATGGATAVGNVAKMAASRVAGDAAGDVVSRMIPGSSGSGEMGSIKGGGAPSFAAKPAPSVPSSGANDDASHYMHGIDFANLKYPNPNAPAPSND